MQQHHSAHPVPDGRLAPWAATASQARRAHRRALVPLRLLLALFLPAAGAWAQAPTAPPANPAASAVVGLPAAAQWKPGATVDTYFGTTVPDPYRALESVKDPEVQRWMKAQAEHTEAVLAQLPRRAAFQQRLQALEADIGERAGQVQRTPSGRWFYYRRLAGEQAFKVVVREPDGAVRVLVDPDAIAKARGGQPHAVNWFAPSPDGKRLAYGVSAAGSEDASTEVLDVDQGRALLPKPVPRTDIGLVAWAADGKSLFVPQLQALKPGQAASDKYLNAGVVQIRLDGKGGTRAAVNRGAPGLKLSPSEAVAVDLTTDGRHALLIAIDGVRPELRMFRAAQTDFLAGKPRWEAIIRTDDGVVDYDHAQGRLYALSTKGSPRRQLIGDAAERFDARTAPVLLPQGETVITGLAAARNALYVERRDGNGKALWTLAHGAAGVDAARRVALPHAGTFALRSSELARGGQFAHGSGLVLELSSWTRTRRVLEVDADGQVRDTGIQKPSPQEGKPDWTVSDLECRSHDGAAVPMTVIHRQGLARDGSHATILYGYGAYGMSDEPSFSMTRLAWLEAGGVYAVVNPRGSGIKGEDWYRAGWHSTKPNTWKDTIACAETLVKLGYTRPQHLGVVGGSAGGILVGRAITERPDLFAAAVPAVGALDMLRMETTANGKMNIPEFGSVATEAGFRSLLAMSTYHQIRDGVSYPAVLLPHGVNDPRVEVWMSSKAAARFQAASASGKPVLLRLDYAGGHGIGNTQAQETQMWADVYAFLAWQLGMR